MQTKRIIPTMTRGLNVLGGVSGSVGVGVNVDVSVGFIVSVEFFSDVVELFSTAVGFFFTSLNRIKLAVTCVELPADSVMAVVKVLYPDFVTLTV